MARRFAALLGRTLWMRDSGGWRSETFEAVSDSAAPAAERLADFVSDTPSTVAAFVYEPEGLAHEAVETPKAGRNVFASLARVRGEHPVVASGNLGWGIEYPEPGPGGAYSTLLHFELTPGLLCVHNACTQSGTRMPAVWSGFTAAASCLASGRSAPRGSDVLILTPGFAAFASCRGSRRSFRAWTGPLTERDGKALSGLMGEFEVRSLPSIADAKRRRGGVLVIADGDPARLCPIWDDLRASARVAAVLGMDEFAAGVARIPIGHPANLAESFPRQRELNRPLAAGASLSLVVLAALVVGVAQDGRRNREEVNSVRGRVEGLQRRLAVLEAGEREADRIRSELPGGADSLPTGRHSALVGISEAVPDGLTLTSLTMGREGMFALDALVTGEVFDPEGARARLVASGFTPYEGSGWDFDAGTGILKAKGVYACTRP